MLIILLYFYAVVKNKKVLHSTILLGEGGEYFCNLSHHSAFILIGLVLESHPVFSAFTFRPEQWQSASVA
jgi:hypothetical protein